MYLFASLCLLTGVSSHNWMEMPASRNGNTDSTSSPCPAGTDADEPNVLVELDYAFTVQWTTNHGGDHFVKIAPLSAESNLESLTSVTDDEDLIFYQTYDVSVPSAEVTISDVLPGFYVLQYGWSNYRNCATIQVAAVGDAPDPVGLDGNPGAISTEQNVDCNSMCSDFEDWCLEVTEAIQYEDRDDCLQKCASFPIGEEGDEIGNTLHCRWHHLHVEGGDPSVHCVHADYNNTICSGGDYLPSVTITVVSEGNTADEIQSEVEASLAAEGYEDVTVYVTDTTSTSDFVVIAQFSEAEDAEELLIEGAFAEILEATNLALDTVEVLGEVALTSSLATNTGSGTNGNIIAAAVLLPLAVITVFGLSYFFRERISAALPGANVDVAKLRRYSMVHHVLSFIVVTICASSGDWAADDAISTKFGLFKYCVNSLCAPMTAFDASAAGAIRAAQAFVLLAIIFAVPCFCLGLMLELKISDETRLSEVLPLLSTLSSVFVFFGICLYSAFFYDVLGPSAIYDLTLGWPADLIGCWWVFTLVVPFVEYRMYASMRSPAKKAPVNIEAPRDDNQAAAPLP